jgi:hypothetical protein
MGTHVWVGGRGSLRRQVGNPDRCRYRNWDPQSGHLRLECREIPAVHCWLRQIDRQERRLHAHSTDRHELNPKGFEKHVIAIRPGGTYNRKCRTMEKGSPMAYRRTTLLCVVLPFILSTYGCSSRDPVDLLEKRIASWQDNSSYGYCSNLRDISYDVRKTDSVVSPYVGTVSGSYLDEMSFNATLAFQDGAWVLKDLTIDLRRSSGCTCCNVGCPDAAQESLVRDCVK